MVFKGEGAVLEGKPACFWTSIHARPLQDDMYVTLHEKTRLQSQVATLRLRLSLYFRLKSNSSNEDKIKPLSDNVIAFSAFYSRLFSYLSRFLKSDRYIPGFLMLVAYMTNV